MKAWEKGRVPPNFRSNLKNQKDCLIWLAKKYNVQHMDDWYQVPSRAFPVRLLKIYNNYHTQILAAHFPEYEWHEWKFLRTPHNYWVSLKNRRRYMDWLGVKLDYTNAEDWYNVTANDFHNNFGHSMIARYYNNCYQRAVMDIYSEFCWCAWLFESVPDGFWKNVENRKSYMKWLGKLLGYTKMADWYNLTHKRLTNNRGYGVFQYLGSVLAVVRDYLPNHEWFEWKFKACSRNFWKSKGNRHRYMDWLAQELGYTKMEGWYEVTSDDFRCNHGGGFLQAYYGSSPSTAVTDNYSGHQWHEWLFVSVPQSFWKRKKNRRRCLDWLAQELGYTKMEDWYSVTVNDFRKNNLGGFLSYHNDSPTQTVIKNYTEYDWEIIKFSTRPQGFWQDSKERKKFLKQLFKLLGYTQTEDWYRASQEDFTSNEGRGLLPYYKGSHIRAIIDNFPKYPWLEWKFLSVPQGFWGDVCNRRQYMNWLAHLLGYSKLEDWYKITAGDFQKNYGGGMLDLHFSNSPSKAVIDTFPEHKWYEWLFGSAPQGYWQDKKHRLLYIYWLADLLGISKLSDWYAITGQRFRENSGSGFLDFFNNSPIRAITDCFPDYNWQIENFFQMRTNQKRVYNIVKEIWEDAVWEYKHPALIYNKSGFKMELDVWIPCIKVGIEYQGEQHFFPIKHWGGELAFEAVQKRDQEKREACKLIGIKLIEVPFTWDGHKKSLIEQIQSVL